MTAQFASFEILWNGDTELLTLIIEHDEEKPEILEFDDSEMLLDALEYRMEEILT